MKTPSGSLVRWTQWLDLPMLIAIGGVLAVLVMIEVLNWGGLLYSTRQTADDAFVNEPAAWVQQRELSAMCGSVSGRPLHPVCENLNPIAPSQTLRTP